MDLHRVPLPAARSLDAAMVKRVGSSPGREARGVDDGGPHGFGARGSSALLGFGNTPVVAKLLAVGLRGRERGLGASRDRIALVLSDSGEDVIVNLVAVLRTPLGRASVPPDPTAGGTAPHIGREPRLDVAHHRGQAGHFGNRIEQRP